MNDKNVWTNRIRERQGRKLFSGLFLTAIGGFWLLGNLDIVSEPARIIVPGLVILWGLTTLFTQPTEK